MRASVSFATFFRMTWMKQSKALFIKCTYTFTFIVVVRQARFTVKMKVENNRLWVSA
jgi:hypothetical protein